MWHSARCLQLAGSQASKLMSNCDMLRSCCPARGLRALLAAVMQGKQARVQEAAAALLALLSIAVLALAGGAFLKGWATLCSWVLLHDPCAPATQLAQSPLHGEASTTSCTRTAQVQDSHGRRATIDTDRAPGGTAAPLKSPCASLLQASVQS